MCIHTNYAYMCVTMLCVNICLCELGSFLGLLSIVAALISLLPLLLLPLPVIPPLPLLLLPLLHFSSHFESPGYSLRLYRAANSFFTFYIH